MTSISKIYVSLDSHVRSIRFSNPHATFALEHTLSDAALFAGGADFVPGYLELTQDQLRHLARDRTIQPLEETSASLEEAEAIAAKAYHLRQLSTFDTCSGVTYLHSLRSYLSATRLQPTAAYSYIKMATFDHAPQDGGDVDFYVNNVAPSMVGGEEILQSSRIVAPTLNRLFRVTREIDNAAKAWGSEQSIALAAQTASFQFNVVRRLLHETNEFHSIAAGADLNEVWREQMLNSDVLLYTPLDVLRAAFKALPNHDRGMIIRHFVGDQRLFSKWVERSATQEKLSKQPRTPQKDLLPWQRSVREKRFRKRATELATNPTEYTFKALPEVGDELVVPSVNDIDNAAFSVFAHLDATYNERYGVTKGCVWQHVNETALLSNTMRRNTHLGRSIVGEYSPIMIAVPCTTDVLQHRPTNNTPTQADDLLRLNIIAYSERHRVVSPNLIDVVYYVTDPKDLDARRYGRFLVPRSAHCTLPVIWRRTLQTSLLKIL